MGRGGRQMLGVRGRWSVEGLGSELDLAGEEPLHIVPGLVVRVPDGGDIMT